MLQTGAILPRGKLQRDLYETKPALDGQVLIFGVKLPSWWQEMASYLKFFLNQVATCYF